LLPLFNNQQKMTKIFYLLLIFLMIGFHGSTQDLREMRLVGEAQKSDSEIVTRRDNNGNLTAAIMVISDMDGFSYDAFNGVIGNVDARPGMDIVYLQTTERVLEIYKTGYRPLKIILADEGIRLRPQEVWQITVAGDELINALPVVIRFTPDDAVLYINNTRVDRANTYSLALGQHNLRIEKEGFQPIERTITVNEQNIFFEYTLQRQPDAGLQIETTPAGATVYLDGVSLGQTPLAAFYKPGIYPIRIVKEGYVTLENQTLEVALPQTRKSYTLEENVGWLTINTHSGASVYFNDQLIANPKNVKLPPQLVKVKVTMPKAEPLEQQVVLKRNDSITIDLFPKLFTGKVSIVATPFESKIAILNSSNVELLSSIGLLQEKELPIGEYIVRVTAKDHFSEEKKIVLNLGEVMNLNFRLNEFAKITVRTAPSGANIFLNDVFVGKTPTSLNIPFKTTLMKVVLEGYDAETITLQPEENLADFFFNLRKQTKTLSVYSYPSNADVFINNRKFGTTYFSNKLEPGKYSLFIRKRGYKKHKELINLFDDTHLNITLKKKEEYDLVNSKFLGTGGNVGVYLKTGNPYFELYFSDLFGALLSADAEGNLNPEFYCSFKINLFNNIIGLKPLLGYGFENYYVVQSSYSGLPDDVYFQNRFLSYGAELIFFPKSRFTGIIGIKDYKILKEEFETNYLTTFYIAFRIVDIDLIKIFKGK
jgi:hypothetical protein